MIGVRYFPKELFLLIILFFGWGWLSPSYAKDEISTLNKKLDQLTKNSALRSTEMGILVYSLSDKKILFERESKKALIPASNVKLITTYSALKELGLNYRFKTYFYTNRFLSDGNIEHLYIRGGGDPYLVIERLWRIAGDLRARGIKAIQGNIIIDEGFFDNNLYPPGWPESPSSRAYHAPTAAFAVNFNTVAVYIWPGETVGKLPQVYIDPNIGFFKLQNLAQTTGSGRKKIMVERLDNPGGDYIRVSGNLPVNAPLVIRYRHINKPIQYAGAVLHYVLEGRGIKVGGQIQSGKTPKDVQEIFVEESPSLSVLIRAVNKHSNNFMAEQILKTMAAERKGIPGSTKKGVAILEDHLKSLGVSRREFRLENGSGLGRENRLSARAFVRVLDAAWKDSLIRPEFISSLALGGLDGTLEDRMGGYLSEKALLEGEEEEENIPEKGREFGSPFEPEFTKVRAKTGSLDNVSSISGYIFKGEDETLAFSIMMNGFKENKHTTIHHIQDQFLNLLINQATKEG